MDRLGMCRAGIASSTASTSVSKEQCVGTEALGQQRRGEVFVHDGLPHGAQLPAVGAHNRHAPASRADDDRAGALQRADEGQA